MILEYNDTFSHFEQDLLSGRITRFRGIVVGLVLVSSCVLRPCVVEEVTDHEQDVRLHEQLWLRQGTLDDLLSVGHHDHGHLEVLLFEYLAALLLVVLGVLGGVLRLDDLVHVEVVVVVVGDQVVVCRLMSKNYSLLCALRLESDVDLLTRFKIETGPCIFLGLTADDRSKVVSAVFQDLQGVSIQEQVFPVVETLVHLETKVPIDELGNQRTLFVIVTKSQTQRCDLHLDLLFVHLGVVLVVRNGLLFQIDPLGSVSVIPDTKLKVTRHLVHVANVEVIAPQQVGVHFLGQVEFDGGELDVDVLREVKVFEVDIRSHELQVVENWGKVELFDADVEVSERQHDK